VKRIKDVWPSGDIAVWHTRDVLGFILMEILTDSFQHNKS
jgi:hypothetical protein